MPQILGSSVSYRIAIGQQQCRKAFMIRTIRPLDRPNATLPSTPWAITSFRRKRIHNPKSARTLLKNAWH